MSTIHVGCAGILRQRGAYAQKLSFAEIELPRKTPKPATLARWRGDVGSDFVFSLAMPKSFWGAPDSPLADAAAARAGIELARTCAAALRPRVLLLRSPRALSPGSAALRRFAALALELRAVAPTVVWEPTGVWEFSSATEFAHTLGLIAVSDPLRDDVSDEAMVYARLRGLGADRRYHTGRLEDLAMALTAADEAFVVFDTPTAFREARALRDILASGEFGDDDVDSLASTESDGFEGDSGDESNDAGDDNDDDDDDEADIGEEDGFDGELLSTIEDDDDDGSVDGGGVSKQGRERRDV